MPDMSPSGPPCVCLSVVLCLRQSRKRKDYPLVYLVSDKVCANAGQVSHRFSVLFPMFQYTRGVQSSRGTFCSLFPYQTFVETLHVRPRICLALSQELLSICLHRSSFDTRTHVGDSLGCDPN